MEAPQGRNEGRSKGRNEGRRTRDELAGESAKDAQDDEGEADWLIDVIKVATHAIWAHKTTHHELMQAARTKTLGTMCIGNHFQLTTRTRPPFGRLGLDASVAVTSAGRSIDAVQIFARR